MNEAGGEMRKIGFRKSRIGVEIRKTRYGEDETGG